MKASQLVNYDAKTVDDLPTRDAETVEDVSKLIDAAADHHRAIRSITSGSLVTQQDDGTISGYVKLEDTTAYAAGQATKLLRSMGATVDRTPGATRNGRVWFELEAPESDKCPNCGGVDLKDGAAVENGKTFDYGCRNCRTVFNKADV